MPSFFASLIASAIFGTKWLGVTRLILCTPCFSSPRNLLASSSTVITAPSAPWLVSWFWQNTQFKLQPAKKTVPDPLFPLMDGSSPKWTIALDTTGSRKTLHNPFSVLLSTLHRLGQISHVSISLTKNPFRCSEKPPRLRRIYQSPCHTDYSKRFFEAPC